MPFTKIRAKMSFDIPTSMSNASRAFLLKLWPKRSSAVSTSEGPGAARCSVGGGEDNGVKLLSAG